jgi:hypothetical protein
MVLQQQPSKWSCLPTAFAMVVGCPVQEVIYYLGHDDERGFHPQELVEWALTKGWAFVEISVDIGFLEEPNLNMSFVKRKPLMEYLDNYDAVLTGETLKERKPHAVAWDMSTKRIFDPNFSCYSLDQFNIEVAWLGAKLW